MTMLTSQKKVSEDCEMQKVTSLKNKDFFCIKPDRSHLKRVVFWRLRLHLSSLRALVGDFQGFFFGQPRENF
jgi:hypothetical protein